MSKITKVYGSTALALVLSAPAAFADVTSADVWANLHAYMESMGYSVSASETTSGDILTLSDITLTMPTVDGFESMSASISEMSLTDQGDGTVRLSLLPVTRSTANITPVDGENITVHLDYAQEGLDVIVSGEPSEMTYTSSAKLLTMSLAGIEIEGVTLGDKIARAQISIQDTAGTTTVKNGDLRHTNQSISTGPVTYDLAFNDPESDAAATIKGGIQSLTATNISSLPASGINVQDMNAMLAAGFAASGNMSYEGGNMDLSFTGPDGAGTAQSTTTSGTIGFSMSAEGLSYEVGQTGLALNALMPDLPLPIAMNMGETKFNLLMPVQKSDEEQDFAFGFTLGDFTVSDMLWSMVDPQAQLPRDPATVALDLSGKAKLLFDFLDPKAAAAEAGDTPGELNALNIKSLIIDAVGARLSGAGDFTFDNTDTTTFGGAPRPEGALDLKLVGGNGLIDKLVAMGLLPEQQAMGARMMMGLFAVAVDGEDTLNSKIEINDKGHILANGQRIQ